MPYYEHRKPWSEKHDVNKTKKLIERRGMRITLSKQESLRLICIRKMCDSIMEMTIKLSTFTVNTCQCLKILRNSENE